MASPELVTDYRERIYTTYGHDFQTAEKTFDFQGARRWGRAQSYQLRYWLPSDKNARILDVGCGSGRLLCFFSDCGYRNLAGVDICSQQVALSKQVTPCVIEGNLVQYLEHNPNSYDLIVGYDIIEHFHKDEVLRFLDGCYSALAGSGRLVLQTPNADSPWGTTLRYGDFTHEVSFNSNVLSHLLRLAGFSEIEAREAGPALWGISPSATIRYFLWSIIRLGLLAWNLVETGTTGNGILTRVFLISGVK